MLAAVAVTIPAGAPAAEAAAPAARHDQGRKAARHQPRPRHAVRKPSRKTPASPAPARPPCGP